MGGNNQMMYFDAKNISDVILHLFLSMDHEVAEDGLKREFPDMLYLFDAYLWPFMTKEERKRVIELDNKIEENHRKSATPMIKKLRYLMEIAQKNKFLRKGMEYQGDMKAWLS